MNYYLSVDKVCKLSELSYSENRYINEPSDLGNKCYIFNHKLGVKNYLQLIISVHLFLLNKEGLFCLPVLKLIYFVYLYQSEYTTSHPGLITMYTAYHPEKLTTEIAILLQIKRTSAFLVES
jgi:hypothetical protein